MKVLSLFSGAGGMDLGLEQAGHTITAMCEIDPHARSVLQHHWPDTPIYEDVTTFDATPYRGTIDVVSGGSPCQNLSVAGKREGLGGSASSLFWHQCRIANQTESPWVIWENVAGALNSNNGMDFAAVLWGLTGFAPSVPKNGWRKMGVCVGPQRTAIWRLFDAQWFGVPQRRRRIFIVAGPRNLCEPEILFDCESLFGDTPTRPQQTENTPTPTHSGTPENSVTASYWDGGQIADTLDVSMAVKGQMLPEKRRMFAVIAAFDSTWSGAYPMYNGDVSPPVKVGSTLGIASPPAIATDLTVRRLTPIECERLMGWPDDWTATGVNGPLSDSQRYKMCGNGVVAPITKWIGQRLP